MRVGIIRMRVVAVVVLLLLVAGLAAAMLFRDTRYRRHLRAAEEALARRAFAEAGRHLRVCLEVHPDDLPARLLAAQAARRRSDFKEAVDHLRAYKRGGGAAEAVELEYRLLRTQQGDLSEAGMMFAFCTEHPEAPETPLVLEALIEGGLKGPEQILDLGKLVGFGKGGKDYYWKQMPRAVEQWLRICPSAADQVQGLVWRGRLHHILDEHALALEDLRKALARDADHVQARFYLATVLVQEAPEEAANHLRMLRQREPKNNKIGFGLAAILHSVGRLEEARQILDEILAEYPNDVSALVERGLLEVDRQRPQDAEHWLRRALELAPKAREVNLALSRCLHRLGRDAEGKAFYDRFLRLESEQVRQMQAPPGQ